MTAKKEYDILRFIEHNRICHISSDVIEGIPLIDWLRYHPHVAKERCLRWVQSIVQQLTLFYRGSNVVCYQYVNPYSMIISGEEELYLLDPGAKSSEEQVKIMRRKIVREHFLPGGAQYYQNLGEETDIYGLGRTIQYLLSSVELEPALSKSEERKFQKLIKRCLNGQSKKSFQHISEIQKFIPKVKPIEKKKTVRSICLLAIAGVMVLAGVNHFSGEKEQEEVKKEPQKTVKENVISQSKEEKLLYEELGLLYFLDFQDYEKSGEYFGAIKDDILAEKMAELSECLSKENVSQDVVRELLQVIEANLPEPPEKYYHCLFWGYRRLETEEAQENLLRIGKICLENADEEEELEIKKHMAVVCEEKENYEEAVQYYSQLLTMELDDGFREELYKKVADLLEKSEKQDEAFQILQEGIKEFESSVELRLQYIRMQYQSMERESLLQVMNEQFSECSQMEQSEEFQKMLKEYGMIIKGGKICEKE